ncbi:MAG: GGDEF domain-containing protein [Burkholderiaceae bacterium]|nr:GGDEF domain-containing protein [Burkholderiaceae bacterium]
MPATPRPRRPAFDAVLAPLRLVWLALALLAALPPPAAMAASTAAAPAAATDETLESLEQQLRADPLLAAEALQRHAQGLAPQDPRRAQALALQVVALAGRDQLAAAERAWQELQRLAQTPQATLAPAAARFAQALIEQRRGPLHRADRLLDEAQALLPTQAPLALRQRMLVTQGRMRSDAGRFDDALRLQQQALSLAESLASPWRRSEAHSSLAYTLLLAQQLAAAQRQVQAALQLARQVHDPLALANALMVDAFLRIEAGDADGEREAMQQAIVQARLGGSRELEGLALANLADHYLKRGIHATALAHAQQALPLARELGDRVGESVALTNSGLALIGLKQRDQGLAYLREALALEERVGALQGMAQILGEQGLYLERAGHLREAYAAYQRHRVLAAQVARQSRQEAMVALQEDFEHQRRERELGLLQRENQLRDTRLRNQALQQQVLVAGAVALALALLVAGLLLHRLRQQGRRLAEHNDSLRRQSERDPLTGLANRRHLMQRMRHNPGGGWQGGLLLLDLDHFKRINDRHGHAAGDAVLVEVARRLQAAVRADDLVARWGGEEFLVLTPPGDAAALPVLAQRLLDAVGAAPIVLSDGSRLQASASIGYAALAPVDGTAPPAWERALDLVDSALYLAKAHGRNRAYGVSARPGAPSQDLQALVHRLEAAWRAGEVQLTALDGPRGEAAPAAAEVHAA